MHPDAIELSYNKTKERVGDDFLVLPFVENVARVEVEIVYDPHYKCVSGEVLSNGNVTSEAKESKPATLCTDPSIVGERFSFKEGSLAR